MPVCEDVWVPVLHALSLSLSPYDLVFTQQLKGMPPQFPDHALSRYVVLKCPYHPQCGCSLELSVSVCGLLIGFIVSVSVCVCVCVGGWVGG